MKRSTKNFLKYLDELKNSHVNGVMDPATIEQRMAGVILLPDTVTYVPDYMRGEIAYHRGFDTVLGYPKSQQINIPFILDIVHPDDQPMVHYLSQLATEFHFDKDRKAPFSSMLEMNFRVRKANGDYIMMLKRSTGFVNENDRPVSTLTMLHNIDFMNVKQVRSRVTGSDESTDLFAWRMKQMQDKQLDESPFSKRETQVLTMMAQGYKSKEIAEKVHLSIHTVHNHRKNMLRKTDLKNTAELVRYGLENGLL